VAHRPADEGLDEVQRVVEEGTGSARAAGISAKATNGFDASFCFQLGKRVAFQSPARNSSR
jgi:hypothetical protein